jgi:hypothetical protein
MVGTMTEPEEYHVIVTGPVRKETILEVLEGADLYWVLQIEAETETGVVKLAWWDDGERWQPEDLGFDRMLVPGDTVELREGYTIKLNAKALTWKQLADGLGKIARGDITQDSYQMRAALSLIVNPEDADWDAWTGEMMLQAALFGHLEFG